MNLPPPPQVADSRAFTDWCYRVYVILTGLSSGQDQLPDATGSAAMGQAMTALDVAQRAELAQLRAQLAELQATVDRLAAQTTAPAPVIDQITPAVLLAG